MKDKKHRQEIKLESEILTFGKHKYETFWHILNVEPSYLEWLRDEGIVKFSDDLSEKIDDAVDDERLDDAMSYGRIDWGLDYGRDD